MTLHAEQSDGLPIARLDQHLPQAGVAALHIQPRGVTAEYMNEGWFHNLL
jgi:hypothetical protein